MEVMKIFSEVGSGERLYSVLMGEEELSLFSEIQREFARVDYAGLNDKQAEVLRRERSRIAEELNRKRKSINAGIWGKNIYIDPNDRFVDKTNIYRTDALLEAKKKASEAKTKVMNNEILKTKNPKEIKNKLSQDTLKSNGSSLMNQTKNFISKNKMALGITAGGAALIGGLYAYNKSKKNEERG